MKFLPGLLLAAAAFTPALHAAENYPSRPVRMIIPSGAGGITDIIGRAIAPRLTDSMGQQAPGECDSDQKPR